MAEERKPRKPADAASGSGVSRHTWAVDSLEEGTASVEHDGDRMFTVPRTLIPAEARQGDVLAVRVATAVEGGREVVTVAVRVDAEATRAATAASARQVKQAPRGADPGGDITL